jgi:hypothetical protein
MTINATSAVSLAKSNGWKVTKTKVEESKRSRSGEHKRWSHDKVTDTFDIPTHIVTFTRGSATITMPVTPDAGLYSGLPQQSVAVYDAAERYRYVRGNRTIGLMSSSVTDGKPILLSDVEKILQSNVGKSASKSAASKSPRKRASAKKTPTAKRQSA